MARTYEEEARRFWEQTLGPNPTEDQIDAELHDYWLCLQEVPKVYDTITDGRFTKPTTMASFITDRVEELTNEAIDAAEEALRAELGECHRVIAELRAVEAVARRVMETVKRERWWSKETREMAYALDQVGEGKRSYLPIPAWIFDAKKRGEGPTHFLLVLPPEVGFPSLDGGHDDIAGVATARKLYGAIAIIRPGEGTRYVMLTVQEAPAPGGDVNDEAVRTLNRIAPR